MVVVTTASSIDNIHTLVKLCEKRGKLLSFCVVLYVQVLAKLLNADLKTKKISEKTLSIKRSFLLESPKERTFK